MTAYPTGAAEHLRREVPDATGVEIFAEGASDPNFEYISTLGADLLVLSAGWWDTGSYGNDRMQQIAPVLPVGKDFTPGGGRSCRTSSPASGAAIAPKKYSPSTTPM
ncbi:hypothetical protein ACETU7_20640 [Rhodococcus sp. 3Y1]